MSAEHQRAKIFSLETKAPLDPDDVQRREEEVRRKEHEANEERERKLAQRKELYERNIKIFLQRFPEKLQATITKLQAAAGRYQELTIPSRGFNAERYREFLNSATDLRSWPVGERAFYNMILTAQDRWQRTWMKFDSERKNWGDLLYAFGNEEKSTPDIVVLQATMRRYAKALKLPDSFSSIPHNDYQRFLFHLREFERNLTSSLENQ